MDLCNINFNDKIFLERRFSELLKEIRNPTIKEGFLLPIMELSTIAQHLDLNDKKINKF